MPELMAINRELMADSSSWDSSQQKFTILKTELNRLENTHGYRSFVSAPNLHPDKYTIETGRRLDNYLKGAKAYFAEAYITSTEKKDAIYDQLIEKFGRDQFIALEKKYNNEYLEDLLMNTAHLNMVYRGKDQLIQKKDPVLMRPYSHIGRAHFYAPYKIIGNKEIPTFIFNLIFIWGMTLFLYMTLLDNSLMKLIKFFESPPGRDERRLSTFGRLFDTFRILFNYPKIYLRARKISKVSKKTA